jgi:hypothetical protein
MARARGWPRAPRRHPGLARSLDGRRVGPFAGDVAARLGLQDVYADHPDRYPHVTLDDMAARQPDIIVLPDEPYQFSASDGPEMFPGQRVALVDGRTLTWYGLSLTGARSLLLSQLAAAG